jgi:A/G-specific adenine glycosylase
MKVPRARNNGLHIPAGPRGSFWDNSTMSLFRRQLLCWYDRNKRDLPWRSSKDPYRIWVSEIMLQQTRVAAVIDYYHRFLSIFPTVEALARAKPATVLGAWSGLGYYRRARAMHAAARLIVTKQGGKFPEETNDLRQLPGIGPYTAAAIASIAFDQRAALVDGNVERVLKRLTGQQNAGKRELWLVAARFLAPRRPGDFNQALMEIGATVCLPEPECARCPVSRWCATRGRGGERIRQPRRRANSQYRLSTRGDSVLLVRRTKNTSLMPGMWELPALRGNGGRSTSSFKVRHSITVTDFVITVTIGDPPRCVRGRWVRLGELESLPLTGLARKILRHANLI